MSGEISAHQFKHVHKAPSFCSVCKKLIFRKHQCCTRK